MRTQDQIEALYRQEGARLWRSVLAYTGDREVANDAVAEAFAQVLARGQEIRNPAGWVWKAAFRIAAGALKQRGRSLPLRDDRSYDMAEPGRLIAALIRLSPNQRASLVLHHYAGYSVQEVAAIIGSTAAAVKVHLSRGRRRLHALLETEHD